MANRQTLLGTNFPGIFDNREIVETVAYDSGASDYLQSTDTLVGIAGTWTIAYWLRRVSSSSQAKNFVEISPGAGAKDRIQIGEPFVNRAFISKNSAI